MLHIGDVINDTYIIKEKPDISGDGSYKAYSRSAKCYVSVYPADDTGGSVTEYFQELEILRSIKNEHMPYIYDAFDDPDGNGFIVGELMQGALLTDLIRRGKRFAPDEAVRTGAEILRVCRYLHEGLAVPVIHGRIAPRTVRIDESGKARLSVISVSSALRLADVKYGDQLHLEYQKDIRGAGEVICFMITGEHCSQPGDVPKNIPKPLRHIIGRTFGADGGYDDAAQALFALERFLDRKVNIAKKTGLAALCVITAGIFVCALSFIEAASSEKDAQDIPAVTEGEKVQRYFVTDIVPELGMEDIDVPPDGADFGDPEDDKYIIVGGEKFRSTVRYLDLSDKGLTDSDIKDIGKFTRLETLCLDGNEISDLTEIGKLSTLKDLWLDRNNVSDLSPLSELKGLTRLTVNDNPVSDLAPISGLTELDQLCIQATEITDISPISQLKKLTKLMMNMNDISDLSPLKELSGLEQLYADKCLISDISPLNGCRGLKILYLNCNSIADISPLSDCRELQLLSAHSNRISSASPVSGLTKLKEINLAENELTDISFALGLEELTFLSLSSNGISDISGIEKLSGLEVLYLRNTLISDASCLADMESLKKISIVRCNIPEEQVDILREKMPGVKFTANYY
ncbi:MAG: leucine-rich repeat domain-containing protein [Huintestinicola sp.]|uniref:leucine-rich repeat domain-containing protein n=1 Tax=Huintestinicola sp. TaxID=2981661 RepID=UPI003F10CA4F